MGEAVAVADDELVEAVARIEAALARVAWRRLAGRVGSGLAASPSGAAKRSVNATAVAVAEHRLGAGFDAAAVAVATQPAVPAGAGSEGASCRRGLRARAARARFVLSTPRPSAAARHGSRARRARARDARAAPSDSFPERSSDRTSERAGERAPPAGEYISGPGARRLPRKCWRKAREKAFAAVCRSGPTLDAGAERRPARGACVYSTDSPQTGTVSHETHLSAKKAQARPDPRVPRRACRPEPAGSRSSADATRVASG